MGASARVGVALITAGRMPASLAAARILRRAGWTVIGTDSLPLTPLSRSRSVNHWISTPSPRDQPEAFIGALASIGRDHGVTLVLPIYEEGFVIARRREELQARLPAARLAVAPLELLALLDDKMRFIAHCQSLNLPVPATMLAESAADLRSAWAALDEDVVLKPVFSRFASSVLIRPSASALETVDPSPEEPWVVQQRISGELISSYGICRQGEVVAHGDYHMDFITGSQARQGLGASAVYLPVEAGESLAFARTLFASLSYDGQYGLDFLRTGDGLQCIECNPRGTSGLHLFERRPGFAALLSGSGSGGDAPAPLGPSSGAVNHLQLLQAVRASPQRWFDPKLWQALLSRDVLFDPLDPWPIVDFMAMIATLTAEARQLGVSVAEHFFHDLACEPR
ncbi:ATP-grasp domain-containing protein [Cyanobium sp. Morenito 9A2]|uniref:ATP-grasp domain-containing protein n=1 Tax=Cyanobium sp. Morenito 9A2 TaxID=2823718 RepID=UPI0020CDF73F|nr:ATP-grasp domain-containing protein [Cyanobium sp. Morenito 9A2]MCP9849390.1 ATP-grasp domain-containing protein [Cyanobium sp. Morenito 9A2]